MNLSRMFRALGIDDQGNHKSPEEAKKTLESIDGNETVAGRLALLTLSCFGRSPEASDELLTVAKNKERRNLERGVGFFATLGSNAPFLGLLGTVLGLTNAFHALSVAKTAGPQVVYEGISEALVTTVVGLLVAIPAVVAYNHLVQKVESLILTGESVAREILAGHIDSFFCNPKGGVSALMKKPEISDVVYSENKDASKKEKNTGSEKNSKGDKISKNEQNSCSEKILNPTPHEIKLSHPGPQQSLPPEERASANRSHAHAR